MTYDEILAELNGLKLQNTELLKSISENRKENESLCKNAEKYKALFEFLSNAVLLEDAESGSIIDANREASLLYGYSHEEFLSLKHSDLSAEQNNNIQSSQDQYIDEAFTYHCKKDGAIFPVDESISQIILDNRPVYIIAIRDNRERLNTDTLVREALSRFDIVVKNTPFMAIQSFNRDGIIQYWNPACEILFGYNALEVIGKPFQKILFFEKDSTRNFEDILAKIWISHEPVSPCEWQIITRTGSLKWILSTMFPILSGDEIVEIFCMNIDITDRKLAEKAMRKSEELFHKMVSTLPDLVVHTDIGGYIIFINEKWIKILSNYNVNDIVGRSIFSFFPKEDIPRAENYIKLMYESKIAPEEFDLILGENNYMKFDVNGEILRLEDSTPNGMVFVCRDINDKKRAEQKIKENEARFNQVAENAGEWIWEVNSEGLFTYSSRIVEKILGYTPEELVGKKYIYEFVLSEILKENKKNTLELFKQKKSFYKFVNVLVHKNGSFVTMEASGSPVLDSEGYLIGYRGVNMDVSEHKRFEDALLESERKFRAVFENAGMGISLIDIHGKPVLVNNSMLKILGYSAKEFTGMVFTEFTHPDDVTRDWELFRELMDGNREFYQIEKRYIDKKKNLVWGMLTMSLIRGSDNTPQYAVGMLEDITERRHTTESLRKSEELFSKAFRDNPAVMSINSLKNYRYIEVNKSFEQHTGYSRDEIIGKTPTEIGLWVTNDELKKLIDGLIEKRSVRNSEYLFRTKRGEMIVVSLSTDIVEFGGELCFLTLAQDITERKRVEKKLIESEERFRVLFEHSPAGIICIYGTVGRVKIMVNSAYATFTGYSRNELEEMSLEEINMTLFFPEDREKEDLATKNFDYEGEKRFRHKNGDVLYAYEGKSSIYNDKTGFYQFISVVQDITERKLAEDARLESERRLFDIIEFFPDPVMVIDSDGIVLAWNRAMEDLSGTKAEDIIGKGNYEYSLPFFGERCPMLVDLVFEPDRNFEKRYSEIGWNGNILYGEAFMPNLRKGTAYLFGTAAVLRNFKGEVVGAIESIRDITERKQAELDKEKLIAELKKALSEIETLQGLIPICSFCKKIRDDKGYWEQIEKYISQRSKAFFSHGICPECMKKHYPEFSDEIEKSNKKNDI